MKKCEPCNLREWTVTSGRLFTCGRPGRGTFSGSKKQIPECVIDLWVDGLPKVPQASIISLLGHKHPSGLSEFSYYPFRSCMEDGANKSTRAGLTESLMFLFLDAAESHTSTECWTTSVNGLSRQITRKRKQKPRREQSERPTS